MIDNNFLSKRYTKKEKEDFLKYLREKGIIFELDALKNIYIGERQNPKAIIVAHYDTYGPLSSSPKKNIEPSKTRDSFRSNLKLVLFLISLRKLLPLLSIIFFFIHPMLSLIPLIVFAYIEKKTKNIEKRFNEKKYSAFDDNGSGLIALLNLYYDKRYKDCLFLMTNYEEIMGIGAMYFCFKNKELVRNVPIIVIDCIGRGDKLVNLVDEGIYSGDHYHFLKYTEKVLAFQSQEDMSNSPYWIHSELDNLIIEENLKNNISQIKKQIDYLF